MTLNNRLVAIGVLNGGSSVNLVERHFQVHERKIYCLQSRYRQTDRVKDRPRSERAKKTTQRKVRYLVTSSRRNRFLTTTALGARLQASTETKVSFGTVRNCLRAAALRSRRPVLGVPLTQRHHRARLNSPRTHLVWTMQQGARVVFTDESRFDLQTADGRLGVWRRKGERFPIPNIVEVRLVFRRKRDGMGWYIILRGCKDDNSGSLIAVVYRDSILEPVILTYLRQGNVLRPTV